MYNNHRTSEIINNDENGLFDKKERFRMVKKEGEKLQKLRQDELVERMKQTEEN